jgi:hypothetical protein
VDAAIQQVARAAVTHSNYTPTHSLQEVARAAVLHRRCNRRGPNRGPGSHSEDDEDDSEDDEDDSDFGGQGGQGFADQGSAFRSALPAAAAPSQAAAGDGNGGSGDGDGGSGSASRRAALAAARARARQAQRLMRALAVLRKLCGRMGGAALRASLQVGVCYSAVKSVSHCCAPLCRTWRPPSPRTPLPCRARSSGEEEEEAAAAMAGTGRVGTRRRRLC